MGVSEWFLSPAQRGNPATSLDRSHRDGSSWTAGNEIEPLVHGAAYFPELLRCVRAMRAGDLLLFTDWRGDPDQLLDGPGTEVARILSDFPILVIANDGDSMGDKANGRFTNVLATIFLIIIVLASVAAIPLMLWTKAGQ
jgi:hypothetical protein